MYIYIHGTWCCGVVGYDVVWCIPRGMVYSVVLYGVVFGIWHGMVYGIMVYGTVNAMVWHVLLCGIYTWRLKLRRTV